jgi:hypothetical protein
MRVEKGVQFQRVGYFAMDPDSNVRTERVKRPIPVLSSDGKVKMSDVELSISRGWVMNRTVTLREDTKKDA